MTPRREADEAALDPFFAAARAAETPPPAALLSAILADAAEAGAARRPLPLPARRPERRRRLGRLFEPIGGWRGIAALGACAAVGFWFGVAGEVTLDGTTLQAGTAATDGVASEVGAFFDLASVEG